MAAPSLPIALNAGDVVSNAWVDAVRAGLAWFRDDAAVFKGQGFSGVGASNSDVTTSTNTTFGFGSAGSFALTPDINVGGWTVQGSDADPESLVVPDAGIYLLNANASFNSDSTGSRQVRLMLNGSVGGGVGDSEVTIGANGSGVTSLECSTLIDLSAGDQLDVQLFQSSGSTLGAAVFLRAVWLRS